MHVINGRGNIVPLLAGIFVLASLLLAIYVNINWLWFTAFVGVNLIISSLTGFCLLEKILIAIGLKEKRVLS